MSWLSGWTYSKSVPLQSPEGQDSYVKSLLHMDGINGSTSFRDAAGKVWTAYGNAQINTAQSKFGGASGLFDGSGDYINTPYSADFDFGTDPFTIDCWVRFNSVPASGAAVSVWGNHNGGTSFHQGYLYNNGGTLELYYSCNSVAVLKAKYHFAWTPNTGQWYHIAWVRNGTSFYIFIDGVSQTLTVDQAVGTNSVTLGVNISMSIGRSGDYNGQYLNGWVDEFRVSKGIARWTEGFTPPTTHYGVGAVTNYQKPLLVAEGGGEGNDAQTVSLLHMDGADASVVFNDEAKGGTRTWTKYGDAQIDTAQSKFGGASLLCDGTGDYIDTPDHADFAMGSGDFTVDMWLRKAGGDGTLMRPLGKASSLGGNADFFIGVNASNKPEAGIYTGATGYKTCAHGTSLTVDSTWHHVALIRNGNNLYVSLDGVLSDPTDVTGLSVADSTYKLAIGRLGEYNAQYWNGWIDEVRISKGIARWTSNFTPPTARYGPYWKSEETNCEGHGLSTFNDLRFTASDGTLLPYWIESIAGSTPDQLAKVRIKFDSIGTGATTFYMYYGKADASAYSNGDDTFLFFDDFPGDSLNADKWSVVQGDVSVVSGELVLTGTVGTRGIIEMNLTNYSAIPIGAKIVSRAKASATAARTTHWCSMRKTGDFTDYVSMYGSINANEIIVTNMASSSYSNKTVTALTLNAWHIFAVMWLSGAVTSEQDDSLLTTNPDNVTTESLTPFFYEANVVVTENVDWVFVAKHVATEPAWGSWGSEKVSYDESLSLAAAGGLTGGPSLDLSPSFSLSSSGALLNALSQSFSDQLTLASISGLGLIGSKLFESLLSLIADADALFKLGDLFDESIDLEVLSSMAGLAKLSMSNSMNQIANAEFSPSSVLEMGVSLGFNTAALVLLSAAISYQISLTLSASGKISISDFIKRVLFEYQKLALSIPSPGPEGDLRYEKVRLKTLPQGPEGDFKYKKG